MSEQATPRSFTILHLSDLHLYTPKRVTRIAKLLSLIRPQTHPASVHDEKAVEALERHCKDHPPDLTIITGDILTDPDKGDLQRALERIESIIPNKKFVVIPGNHDLRPFGLLSEEFSSSQQKAAEKATGEAGVLESWQKTVRALWVREPRHLPGKVGCWDGLLLLPIDSIGLGKWARGGVKFSSELCGAVEKEIKGHKQALRIALLHHPPVPTFARAGHDDEPMTMLENAGEVLKRFSEWGIDLVLHGHDHAASLYRIAIPGFKPMTVTGAPSAFVPGNDGSPGFFQHRIEPAGAILTELYQLDKDGEQFERRWPVHLQERLGSEGVYTCALSLAGNFEKRNAAVLCCDVKGFHSDPGQRRDWLLKLWQAIHESRHAHDSREDQTQAQQARPKDVTDRGELAPDVIQQLNDEFILIFCDKTGQGNCTTQAAMHAAAKLAAAAPDPDRLRLGLHYGPIQVVENKAWREEGRRASLASEIVVQARQISRCGLGGYVLMSDEFRKALQEQVGNTGLKNLLNSIELVPSHIKDGGSDGEDTTFNLFMHSGAKLYWTRLSLGVDDGLQCSRPGAGAHAHVPPRKFRAEFSKFSKLAEALGDMSYSRRGQTPITGLQKAFKDLRVKNDGTQEVFQMFIFDDAVSISGKTVRFYTDGKFLVTPEGGPEACWGTLTDDAPPITAIGDFYEGKDAKVSASRTISGKITPDVCEGVGLRHLAVKIPKIASPPSAKGANLFLWVHFQAKGGLEFPVDFVLLDITEFDRASKGVEFNFRFEDDMDHLRKTSKLWVVSDRGIETKDNLNGRINIPLPSPQYRFFAVEVHSAKRR